MTRSPTSREPCARPVVIQFDPTPTGSYVVTRDFTLSVGEGVQLTHGLDDPRDDTLTSVTRRDWRRRHQAYAIGVVHKLSPEFSWGLEQKRTVTHLAPAGRRASNHLNLAATFAF